MRELALLWLFAAAGIGVVLVTVVLALGVVFGVVRLMWKLIRFFLGALGNTPAREVRTDVIPIVTGEDASLPRRVRWQGPGRLVRVQVGLVPPSPCRAQRNPGGVGRRRQSGTRLRDD